MEKESEDELISKKKFQKASGVNLDNFLIGSIEKEADNILARFHARMLSEHNL